MTAVRCLLDPCCTHAMASKSFSEFIIKNGYTSEASAEPVKWASCNGNFTTNQVIHINKARIPNLNEESNFDITLHVMPHNNCIYEVIIGGNIMHMLNLDVCITSYAFIWINQIIPMVPRGYWTHDCICKFCHTNFITDTKVMGENGTMNTSPTTANIYFYTTNLN